MMGLVVGLGDPLHLERMHDVNRLPELSEQILVAPPPREIRSRGLTHAAGTVPTPRVCLARLEVQSYGPQSCKTWCVSVYVLASEVGSWA
jgi:hypothetical protein